MENFLVSNRFGGQYNSIEFLGSEFTTWKEFSKRGIEVSLPKTGNHAQLFATSGMDYSATKEQVTKYISRMMVQFLIEYEDNNGNFSNLRGINIFIIFYSTMAA